MVEIALMFGGCVVAGIGVFILRRGIALANRRQQPLNGLYASAFLFCLLIGLMPVIVVVADAVLPRVSIEERLEEQLRKDGIVASVGPVYAEDDYSDKFIVEVEVAGKTSLLTAFRDDHNNWSIGCSSGNGDFVALSVPSLNEVFREKLRCPVDAEYAGATAKELGMAA
jgi:hypothetical protein